MGGRTPLHASMLELMRFLAATARTIFMLSLANMSRSYASSANCWISIMTVLEVQRERTGARSRYWNFEFERRTGAPDRRDCSEQRASAWPLVAATRLGRARCRSGLVGRLPGYLRRSAGEHERAGYLCLCQWHRPLSTGGRCQ